MCRAYTKEEARKRFLGHLHWLVEFWDSAEKHTSKEKLDGIVHSILCMFDGVSEGPAYDLVARPNPVDKSFYINEGEDWIEDGTVINDDVMFHELWYEKKRLV